MKWIVGLLLLFMGCFHSGVRLYKSITFGINCGGRIKRAADSNTIELAKKEMQVVVLYLEDNDMTKGYTSILYKTPDEDVGFWYENLKSALDELEKVKPSISQLEKSNLLMKLRETLLDEDASVTLPMGISIFPNNVAYCMWGWFSCILFLAGGVVLSMAIDDI